jgi:hypothetical protein
MCERQNCIAILQKNKAQIQDKFEVTSLLIFGSVARGDNKPDSDVDILVDMPPKIFLMGELKDYLESLLLTSVDLIRRHSHLSEEFLKQISRDAIPIF